MSRLLGKKVVLAGDVVVSGDADARSIAAAAEADSANLVIPLDDDEPLPRTLDEVEALTERAGRLLTADRTKARTLISDSRTRTATEPEGGSR